MECFSVSHTSRVHFSFLKTLKSLLQLFVNRITTDDHMQRLRSPIVCLTLQIPASHYCLINAHRESSCFPQGVCVPGLGIFTYSQKKLDVGNNKYIQIQRPVFILSEKFAMTHALNYTKHHTTGKLIITIADILFMFFVGCRW